MRAGGPPADRGWMILIACAADAEHALDGVNVPRGNLW